MKNTLLMALLMAFACSFTVSTHAQEPTGAKKFDNPQWKRVDLLAFKPGTAERAREIIHQYFEPASEKSGTPKPSLVLQMFSGEWDLMVIWDMKGGLEDMNWETSPDDVKWISAMNTLAGSAEKAKAINTEFSSLIARSARNIAKAGF